MKPEAAPAPEIHPEKGGTNKEGISRRGFLKAALGAAILGAASKLEKLAQAAETIEGKETLEKQYRDWREFKKIIQEQAIKRQIDHLKEKFGRAIDSFIFKPVFDLQVADELAQRESAGEDLRKTEQGRNFLKEAAETYNRFWNSRAIDARLAEREKRDGLQASFSGFETLPGWTNEKVRMILEQNFNRRWLYGNIGSFQYVDQPERQAHYRVAGRAESRGIQSILTKSERQAVKIYRHAVASEGDFLRLMAHEIGHHQDWENNNRLPIQERIEFLREVTDHFEFEGRMRHRYLDVEIPKEYADKKADPKEMLYRQVKEYWAILAESYATEPEALKRDHPADYLLVKEWSNRLGREYETPAKE